MASSCTDSHQPYSSQVICIFAHAGMAALPVQNIQLHQPQAGREQLSMDSYMSIARAAALQAGISPELFVRQFRQESEFNPAALSAAGAIGIAQFMPATAASMGVDPFDPVQSLYGAARLMADLSAQYHGDYAMALAAYNAGPGYVQAAIKQGGSNWRAFLPAETQNYITIILGS